MLWSVEASLLAVVALLLGGSGGGIIAYVVATSILRKVPRDTHVDDLIASVEKLNQSARRSRMREVRAGLAVGDSPTPAQTVVTAINSKASLRARLRARNN